jgi:hypothetical protein
MHQDGMFFAVFQIHATIYKQLFWQKLEELINGYRN